MLIEMYSSHVCQTCETFKQAMTMVGVQKVDSVAPGITLLPEILGLQAGSCSPHIASQLCFPRFLSL